MSPNEDPTAPPASGEDWVAVAVVMRPHGLQGLMRLRPLTKSPGELIEAGVRRFHVRRQSRIEASLTLLDAQMSGDLVLARFQGIDDRETAQKYVNCELVIREVERWSLPPGSYYVDHLAGLEVLDHRTGRLLGRIKTAQEGAAHDYLVLDLEAAPGADTLLPLIPQFVPRVDIEGGRVEITLPEGLLD